MRPALRMFALVILTAVSVSAQQVYKSGDAGVTLPVAENLVKPQYTPQAMNAQIQGTVLLEGIVRADGTVDDAIVVTRSLDKEFGLDEQAVQAFKESTFKPGTRDGKPVAVAVAVAVEMSFTLK